MLSTPVRASRAFVSPLSSVALAAWLVLALSDPAWAQASARSFAASIGASTTYSQTSGRDGSAVQGDGEFVTQLSPGLRWSSRAGRVQGSASYGLNLVNYSRQRDADSVQHSLAAALSAEAIEGHAFIDANANIAQQSISPFGIQSVDNGPQAASNRTQVASASISPYVRGSIGRLANYNLRFAASGTRATDLATADSNTALASLTLSSANTGSKVGWGINATRQRVDFRVGGESQIDRLNVSVFYRPLPDLQLGVSGGQESTDIIGTAQRSYDNWGASLRWSPGPRTNVSVQAERRFFGNSHTVVFSHRMRQTVWQYTDSRGATSGSDPNGLGQPVTLFALYNLLFASVQPDPALRELLVLQFLQSIGRQPGELVSGGGLLTAAASNQRRQDLSFAINGVRTSFSLLAFRNETRPLDGAVGNGVSDLPVRQTGLNSALSYRLTSQSSLSLSASYLVVGDSGTLAGNDLTSLALTWSNRPTRNLSTALTGRYSLFDGTDSYREAAIVASVNYQF